MTEREFTDELIVRISPAITTAKIATGMSVLYEMPIDDDGVVHMGVDADTGEAIRGRGTGFEQDILIFEEREGGHTAVVPRVIAEVKLDGVTTHEAIVYSNKAESIKRIYQFCRYGMVLGGFKTVPGRVLRHGRNFDFICSIDNPLIDTQVEQLKTLLLAELETSRRMGAMLKGRLKPRRIHRNYVIEE